MAAYRGQVAQCLAQLGWGRGGREPLAGPLAITVLAAPPDRRATDADNRLKCLLDALVHGGLLADDSNRVIRRLEWEWTDPVKGGAVSLAVKEMK